ncbi:MAG TPA: zf-HC2 domain-containing protein [Streptosporangiaceae bacterium]
MSGACAGWRGDIGAYIVGALDDDHQAWIIQHLNTCAACRAEYEDLLPVRRWLSLLAEPGDLRHTAGGVPAGLLAADPARPRIWHRRRWQAVAAAGAVAVAAAITAVAVIPGGHPVPAFQAVDRMTGVRGQVRLLAQANGTEIDLTISGLPSSEHCTLLAVSGTGTDIAGTWSATYKGTAQVSGTSAIPQSRLTALLVEAPTGQLLIRIPV